MSKSLTMLLLSALAVTAFSGCPPGGPPPFDASGDYSGTWSGQTEGAEKTEEVVACPLTMSLVQAAEAAYPKNRGVTGVVEIDFSCLVLPEWIEEPPPALVNVTGILLDDGTLGLLTGGCGTGLCVALGLKGTGEDVDLDGFMDTYSGEWSYVIMLAGVQPFGVKGVFSVEVDLFE
ncbi:MAG: hypothetical protein GWP08_13215 [Nitrospiraceae bacterium]|nr:hypothetical protein [Nitrospiraceae bacterium]